MAGSRVTDVNAVHPHVDIILHVTPLLIIVKHESPVTPKVKPVSFPPPKYGAFKIKPLLICVKFIYTGFTTHLPIETTLKHKSCPRACVLTLPMKPTTLYHGHTGGKTYQEEMGTVRSNLMKQRTKVKELLTH